MGQSIFSESLANGSFVIGDTVAVFGSIDHATGSIENPQVISLQSDFSGAFLTGVVDEVNLAIGTAVVSGVTVDYTGLLGNGVAPNVGQTIAVSGYVYSDVGLIAAP